MPVFSLHKSKIYTAGLVVLVVVLMYLAWVYLIEPEWESRSNNINFSAYKRRMQVLLQQTPSNLSSRGTCDAAANCSWLPIKTCDVWKTGQHYTKGFREQKDYDPDHQDKPLRAFKDANSCEKYGTKRLGGFDTCINMNEVYCGSLDWVAMFTGRHAMPWVTSTAGVVKVNGYKNTNVESVVVPFDATHNLLSECIEENMNDIWKVLSDKKNLASITEAITKIISIAAPGIPAAKIATGVSSATAAFGEFVKAYKPAKMDLYSCQSKQIIESKGVDSGGALGWIGNVRTSLSKFLIDVTGGQVKSIDQLAKQDIQKAWALAIPNANKKTSLLYNYFEKASETAVQRMINLLIGPGPDYTKNDGKDTYEHFQLASQLCSLGMQQTDDDDIHNKTTTMLEKLFHHDK